ASWLYLVGSTSFWATTATRARIAAIGASSQGLISWVVPWSSTFRSPAGETYPGVPMGNSSLQDKCWPISFISPDGTAFRTLRASLGRSEHGVEVVLFFGVH